MISKDAKLSRRSFMSGKLKAPTVTAPIFRPPWVTEERLFDACSRCGDCMKACPLQIIASDSDNYPVMDFSRSGCDYCGDCADSCSQPVFLAKPERHALSAWRQRAELNERCLTHHDVMCQSCQDGCQPEAIRFIHHGRIARPTIDPDLCDGCGFCLAICPTQALDLTVNEKAHHEYI